MKKIDEHRYQAEENKTFVHKTTLVRMGNGIYLADADDISNYTEEPMTEAELAAVEAAKRKQEDAMKERSKRAKTPSKKG